MRTNLDEIDVETLVPATKTSVQAIAVEIFEVDAPAPVLGQVRCKIVLGGGRPFTNGADVLPEFDWQDIDVMGIPWIIAADTPLWKWLHPGR